MRNWRNISSASNTPQHHGRAQRGRVFEHLRHSRQFHTHNIGRLSQHIQDQIAIQVDAGRDAREIVHNDGQRAPRGHVDKEPAQRLAAVALERARVVARRNHHDVVRPGLLGALGQVYRLARARRAHARHDGHLIQAAGVQDGPRRLDDLRALVGRQVRGLARGAAYYRYGPGQCGELDVFGQRVQVQLLVLLEEGWQWRVYAFGEETCNRHCNRSGLSFRFLAAE